MNDPSATPLFPAFPNDPAEHLLGEYNVQMMQLELPVAESFPRRQERVILPCLIYCLLSSPPSWTRLKHPGRAACVAKETRFPPSPPQARLALGTSPTSLSVPAAALMTAVKRSQALLSRIPASLRLGWVSNEGRTCGKRERSTFSPQPYVCIS